MIGTRRHSTQYSDLLLQTSGMPSRPYSSRARGWLIDPVLPMYIYMYVYICIRVCVRNFWSWEVAWKLESLARACAWHSCSAVFLKWNWCSHTPPAPFPGLGNIKNLLNVQTMFSKSNLSQLMALGARSTTPRRNSRCFMLSLRAEDLCLHYHAKLIYDLERDSFQSGCWRLITYWK